MPEGDYPPGGELPDYLAHWAVWALVVAGTVLWFRRTRGRTGKLRLVAGNALVFLCLLVTVVVLAETWLRYVYDTTDSYGVALTNRAWFRRHVRFNSAGCRDREWPATTPPGAARVDFVGDSFTMGWGVDDMEDTFGARVRSELERREPGRWDVRIVGHPGWSTANEYELISRHLRQGPVERVVLAYCLNDTDDLLPPDVGFRRYLLQRPAWIASERSFLADQLWFRLVLSRDPHMQGYFEWVELAYTDPVYWSRQRERLLLLQRLCADAGTELDLVLFPFVANWGPDYPFDVCHDRVAAACRDAEIPLLDLRDAYRGRTRDDLVVNSRDGHPNELAHRLAADAILARFFPGR